MSPLRVIGGIARGHPLALVPGDKTRPISDRVKESLFNIIREDLPGANFLDLFAGTGSVGIEALSRGASSATFIEKQLDAIRTIKQNLLSSKMDKGAIVRHGNAFAFISSKPAKKFDYIFIAPPQYKNLWEKALLGLDQNINLMVADAWVIIQIDKREYTSMDLEHLEEFDQRKYGNTLLVFYERKAVE